MQQYVSVICVSVSVPPSISYKIVSREICIWPSLQLYYEVKDTPKAVEILGKALVSHPHLVDEELVNLLAELCISSKAYEQVYEVRCEHVTLRRKKKKFVNQQY